MRFNTIEELIKSITLTYKCPECKSKVNKKDIEIIGIAGNSANLDVVCPKCGVHSLVATQMVQMNMNLSNVKKNLAFNMKKISDEEIISLNKDLKKNKINVSDLFE